MPRLIGRAPVHWLLQAESMDPRKEVSYRVFGSTDVLDYDRVVWQGGYPPGNFAARFRLMPLPPVQGLMDAPQPERYGKERL